MNMRLYSIVFGAWLFAGVGVVHASPTLICDQTRFNFSQAIRGTTIEHAFVLVNAGDSDLKINKIDIPCGCTVAELKSKVIPPGQSIELPVKLSLGNERGFVRKSVTVESDDAKQPKLTLWLEGHVYAPFTLAPAQLFFGSVRPEQSATRTVDVTIDEQARLKIRGHVILPRSLPGVGADKDMPDGLSVQVEPVTAGTMYRVTIAFDPKGKFGRLDAIVRLQTDSDTIPTIDIPVSAVVAGELNFTPQTVLLSTQHTDPVTRYILVTRNRAAENASPSPGSPGSGPTETVTEGFQVTKVHVPHDDIAVEVRPVGKLGYRIRLSNLVASAELVGQSIVIETDVAAMPKLTIPIQIAEGEGAEGKLANP